MRALFSIFVILSCFYACPSMSEAPPPIREDQQQSSNVVLKSGWYLWDPYQYVEGGEGFKGLAGLDIQLVKAIAKTAGYNVFYEEVPWRQHLNDLKTGKRHFAAGATYTKERAKYYHYSEPYRREENALYVRKGELKKYNFGDVEKTLIEIKQKNLRVSVVDGFIYADSLINDFIADPTNAKYIVKASNDFESLENLLNRNVECFFSDRLVASTIAWRKGKREKIEEHYLGIGVDIHLIFSKKIVSKAQVAEFNLALQKIKDTGEYGDIIKSYLLPVLLLQTTDRPWFFIIDLIGTIAFALSGLIVAFHERTTIFGALVFAALPSVGGGVLRDIIVDRKPIGVMGTPLYAIVIVGTVLLGYVITHYIYPYILRYMKKKKGQNWGEFAFADRYLLFFDSLGQAAFTISGVVIAVVSHSEPLWIWGPVLAALTGAGGGILRDMLRTDRFIFALRGSLYAEISLIWGLIVSILIIWEQDRIDPDYILVLVVVSMIGCFATRMLTTYLDIKSTMFGEPLRRALNKKK